MEGCDEEGGGGGELTEESIAKDGIGKTNQCGDDSKEERKRKGKEESQERKGAKHESAKAQKRGGRVTTRSEEGPKRTGRRRVDD